MSVYRTYSSEITQQWQQRCDQQAQARRDDIDRFLREHLLPGSSQMVGDDNLLDGIAWNEDQPPAGWRYHRARPGVITPDTTTSQGTQAAMGLAKITHGNALMLLPGQMPASITVADRLVLPRTEVREGLLWVLWPVPLPEADQVRLDTRIWQEMA